jgi:hypothetical protein
MRKRVKGCGRVTAEWGEETEKVYEECTGEGGEEEEEGSPSFLSSSLLFPWTSYRWSDAVTAGKEVGKEGERETEKEDDEDEEDEEKEKKGENRIQTDSPFPSPHLSFFSFPSLLLHLCRQIVCPYHPRPPCDLHHRQHRGNCPPPPLPLFASTQSRRMIRRRQRERGRGQRWWGRGTGRRRWEGRRIWYEEDKEGKKEEEEEVSGENRKGGKGIGEDIWL